MIFIGPAKRLDNIDLPKIGKMIGVGEDPIHAVIDTETTGSGFDSKGRPKMLFEPHIFHRLLRAAGKTEELEEAVHLGLAYPKWGQAKYPLDSYPRIELAMGIDEHLALMSASWGLGQIMGFNAQLAGYESVEKMVQAFTYDEENHLTAMIRFIVSAGLDDELRALEKARTVPEMMAAAGAFALGYNGKGFARNGYDVKMVNRLIFWRGKPDTPYAG